MAIKTFPRLTLLMNDDGGEQDFISKELNRRKDRSFGANAVPRAIWVRAVSNAVSPSNTGIIGNLNVLAGGLLSSKFHTRGSFETLYARPGRQIKDRPIPGIESIEVTSKGELQSLRKLTLTWLCPSIEELDILTPYWLSPGVSVIVEWGWSVGNAKQYGMNVEKVETIRQFYYSSEKIYNELIKPSNGNQDAYIGIITNFTFNQNDDNSWSCTTELTSLGQTLLALNLEKDKIYVGIKEDSKRTINIREFIEDGFSEGVLKDLRDKRSGFTWGFSGDVIHIKTDDIDEDFVTWDFIEKAIVADHAELITNGVKEHPAYTIDSSKSVISDNTRVYSTDANIGLVVHESNNGANAKLFGGQLRNLYFNAKFVKDTFLKAKTLEECLMKLLNEMSRVCASIWEFKIQPKVQGESVLEVVDLRYTNPEDIKKINATNDNKTNVLSFGGLSGKSILSSVSFTSKLTEELALKYAAGRNRSPESENMVINGDTGAGIDAIFGGTVDRILYPLDPHKSPPITKDKQRAQTDEQEEKAKALIQIKNSILLGGNALDAIKEPGFPHGIIVLPKEALQYLKEIINAGVITSRGEGQYEGRSDQSAWTSPIYPLEVSVTIDGIAGILPGNCFVLDNVPKIYKENGVFQVVEVGHSVSGDDWETTLRCMFRYTKADFAKATILKIEPEPEVDPDTETIAFRGGLVENKTGGFQ